MIESKPMKRKSINTTSVCLKSGKNCFFFIHQISEKTEWRCKFQSKRLRKALQDNGTAHCERWIHVHLPSVDEHAVHPTGDVSLEVLLVVIYSRS